jgi:hypothetical protein
MLSISKGSDAIAPPLSPAEIDRSPTPGPAPIDPTTPPARPNSSDPAMYVAQVALLQCRDLVDRLLRRNDLEGLMRVQRVVAAEVSATEAQTSPWRAGTGVRPGLPPRIMTTSAGISPSLLLFMPPKPPQLQPPPAETINEVALASPASAADSGSAATAAMPLAAHTQGLSYEIPDTAAKAKPPHANGRRPPPVSQRPSSPQPSLGLVAEVTQRLEAEKLAKEDADLIRRLSAVLDFWAGVSMSALRSRYGLSMQLIRQASHVLLTQGLPDYLILPRRTRSVSLRQAKRPTAPLSAAPLDGPSNPSER